MTAGDGRPFGDEPDDAEDTEHDSPAGGWVPPRERVWRHPSELFGAPSPEPPARSGRSGSPASAPGLGRTARRPLATVAVGLGAAAAVVTGVVLLVNTGYGHAPTPLAEGRPALLTAAADCCRSVPAAATGTERALVSLRISGPGGLRQACGVAFGLGGLVVTTADALGGSRSISALGDQGDWTPAAVVGEDPTADVAVLRVAPGLARVLPPARFEDDATLSADSQALVVTDAPRERAAGAATMWARSSVRAVASGITGGAGRGLAAITTTRPSLPAMSGEALLDRNGTVLGLLDGGARQGGGEVFLPGSFVVEVADRLLHGGRMAHGWLDVALTNVVPRATVTTTAATSRPERGAEVMAVMANGASAGRLSPGDLIVAVDGQPVRSTAELRSRLYVLPPGSSVQLDVWRASTSTSVDVALGASP